MCEVMLRNIGAWSSHMCGDAAEYCCLIQQCVVMVYHQESSIYSLCCGLLVRGLAICVKMGYRLMSSTDLVSTAHC